MVDAFFAECETNDPEKFAEVCDKYPTLSQNQHRAIRRREHCVGLLGLQPAYVSPELARRRGFESVYDESDD
jgi:hypothetical protein